MAYYGVMSVWIGGYQVLWVTTDSSHSSPTSPSRLETRTKESILYASCMVVNHKA